MTKIFQQTPSSQAPSYAFGITQDARSLADTDLMDIVGGERGEISFTFGLSFGTSQVTPPFSADLLQVPAGAVEPHTVPWAELTPPVKKQVIVDRVDA